MAVVKYNINGFGQVELNNVAFRRDGRIEAQCALSTNDFSAAAPCENGMLVAVDKANGLIKKPAASDNLPRALVYTAEHMYDERKLGLKDFALTPDDGLYPRVGYLSVGETFTTNCFAYDSTAYATETALNSALASCKTKAVYGVEDSSARICLVSALPTDAKSKFKVVADTTMPDGQKAVKLQVIG